MDSVKCGCGGELVRRVISPEAGGLLYKYYRDSDTVEHYDRYELSCLECGECGQRQSLTARGLQEDTVGNLTEKLDSEGAQYGVCPLCGGRLIAEMAGMGGTGKLLGGFSEESFTYSFALFDMCADCGRIFNVHEKLMGV